MNKLSLSGKVAIITGSSSGMGAETAVLFVSRGAKVVITGRDEPRLRKVEADCKRAASKQEKVVHVVAGNLTDVTFRPILVATAVREFGKLDILVNNAGALRGEPLGAITERALDEMMDLMFKAPIFLSQCALPHLKKSGGCIVNVSTAITTENFPGFFSYTVAKAALDKFTEFAAKEFPAGIRVNSVKPGISETPIFDVVLGHDKNAVKEFLDTQKKFSMLGRNGQPGDMAEMIAFLSSDAASYCTGQHFVVDGGRSKNYHHQVA